MRDLPNTPFVILSASVADRSMVENFRQSVSLKEYLLFLDLKFKMVQGRYEGKDEIAFVIPNLDYEDALDIASYFNQETVLAVDAKREAWLLFTDGSDHKYLGYWSEVQGQCNDNYTLDGEIKYTCIGGS